MAAGRARRIAVLAAAALAGLVALEFSLRLFAVLARRAPSALGDGPLVWCVGDSNTAGSGAPAGEGYPEQLARLAAERGAPLRTLNLGAPGANSSTALKIIRERLLAGERPDAVVALFGENDQWNLSNVEPARLFGPDRPPRRLLSLLQRLRAAQFARGVALRLLGPAPLDLAYAGRWAELEKKLSKTARRARNDELLLAAAEVFLGEFARARDGFEAYLRAPRARVALAPVAHETIVRDELARLAWFEEPASVTRPLFEMDPGRELDDRTLYRLGRGWWRLQNGDASGAKRQFDILLAEPELQPLERAFALEGLCWAALARDEARRARRLCADALTEGSKDHGAGARRLFAAHAGLAFAEARRGDARAAARAFAQARPRDSRALALWKTRAEPLLAAKIRPPLPPVSYLQLGRGAWLRANLDQKIALSTLARNQDELAALGEEFGVRVFFMTYPQAAAYDVNRAAREAAARARRPLIDLAATFEALPPAEAATLFSADKYHPGAAGYAVIARRVYEVISAAPPSRTSSPRARR